MKSPFALITGASSGIGRELAHLFAADGQNLILVARNGGALESLAGELRARHGIETRCMSQDLSAADAPREIFDACRDVEISVLVNNAGFGSYGAFAESALETQTGMMQVNMTALVELTHRFVNPMLKQGAGRILNVGSVAGFQPGPTVNVYYATKAFVYSFSYALADELEGTGVTVTVLCPGTTRTAFFERANLHMKRPWPMMDAREVARQGYRGMLAGKRVVIPGLMNSVMARLSPCFPSRWSSAVVREVHRQEKRGEEAGKAKKG